MNLRQSQPKYINIVVFIGRRNAIIDHFHSEIENNIYCQLSVLTVRLLQCAELLCQRLNTQKPETKLLQRNAKKPTETINLQRRN